MRTKSASDNRKKRHRRRHGLAFYTVPIALLMTITLGVLLYNLLKVETILVEGTTRYQTDEILSASGLKAGDKMFKIKPSAVTGAIEQKLSYIGEAKLSFQLPSTVILTVSEASVACSLETADGYILLSDKFKILQAGSPMADANVPIIRGLKPKEVKQGELFKAEKGEDITVIQELFDAIAEYTFPDVKLIDISDISNISLKYGNENKILLGGPSQLTYKIRFVKEVLNKNAESNNTGGLTINAQTLDSKAHPYVSVLPATTIYTDTSSTPPGSSNEEADSSKQGGQADASSSKSSSKQAESTKSQTSEEAGSATASASSS
ncbi:cell division protein FtsQ/DivIB [Acetanaerobacterium elongatum]|uniref:Cell division septal protein FtsQ n=1 Tax=Acetanaerobacterium elongatum TaxID=258515 RepID=A0A1G9VHV8_9FIRM|nr:FtsQ-type POTRA domain-containing protein [Acetanaerobacterium elongatum]SDM71706.1 Cell division septal protein FtsQ [Acetanaerobacterium elongatum]